jgi:hypothetical protein
MKSIKLLLPIFATILLSATSCKKNIGEILSSTSIGFNQDGLWITVNIGNGGGYYYDYSAYQNYGYGPSAQSFTAVVYVISSPTNSTSIPVYVKDRYGNFSFLGTADCVNGVSWQVANYQLQLLQNWFIQHPGVPCAIVGEFDPRYTNAPWSIHLRF